MTGKDTTTSISLSGRNQKEIQVCT
ncbi:unnamed protein product [Ranitomeya imitator]|uniref:Uncharacterized protein n=1 Tax=Ranitomeya imitator TaxID=111125 RepID=A0ABN9M2C2_9NEOB|nr:unnamed protein product [Ranitomeya imitator]